MEKMGWKPRGWEELQRLARKTKAIRKTGVEKLRGKIMKRLGWSSGRGQRAERAI